MKITDFVYDGNYCQFEYYRKNVLYYSIYRKDSNDKYIFPVPMEDLGDATINNTEKSILLMRYIRIASKDTTLVPYN